MSTELTQARLKELLHYDPETGVFTWVGRTGKKSKPGKVAGGGRPDGYVAIGVEGVRHLAHRLAWLYVYGAWPEGHLDHADGVRRNNSARNLRVCDDAENGQNRSGPNANNRLGLLGVCLDRRYGTYSATITHQRSKRHLGTFKTAEEAHKAYLAAKARLHTFQPTPRTT